MEGVNVREVCTECGEIMTLKQIPQTFNVKGKKITIDGINAYVCEHCGEVVYTSIEAKMIERVIGAIRESTHPDVQFLNLCETADYLRVSNQTIYNMIRDGRIKAYKVGREWRFIKSDILAYMSTTAQGDSMAAKGGEISVNDLKILSEEIERRKDKDE